MSTHESSPPKAELTPAQQAVKQLADEMLEFKDPGWNVMPFVVDMDPQEVEQKLRNCSVADILLKDGDSLSAVHTSEYEPELDLFIGKAQLYRPEIKAWGWDYDLDGAPIRDNPAGAAPDTVVGMWGRRLEVILHFSNGKQIAAMNLGADTWSYHGSTPHVFRNVRAAAYAEMGYDGHNAVGRDATEEEIVEFTGLVRELFEHRVGKK